MKKILLLSATFLISFSLFANKEKTKKTLLVVGIVGGILLIGGVILIMRKK
jgi:formate hydrogenlyase subunit 3/multisubunit Na+/H+ antiporter MnhD subunit